MAAGENERILGGAGFGIEGGELMSMLEIMMMGELPCTALADGVCAHPMLAQGFNNLFVALTCLWRWRGEGAGGVGQ